MRGSSALVSTIIPAYNAERYLAEAIESVLAQRHRPLEIIVVDDGSTDDTPAVAAAFEDSVVYVHQANSGPAVARNRGLRLARGDVIAFLDADDMWIPAKLELQLPRLAHDPSVSVVLGRKQFVYGTALPAARQAVGGMSAPQMAASLGCGVFRRPVFDEVGVFDEALYYCDDWDWFMRARELGVSFRLHRDVVLLYRRHKDNLTNRVELNNHYIIRMLKQSIERRRQRANWANTSLPQLSVYEEEGNDAPT